MLEIVEKGFEMAKNQSRKMSTERDQFEDINTRDKLALFLIFYGVDEDTFDTIEGAPAKYVQDILQKTREEIKTETTHRVIELEIY